MSERQLEYRTKEYALRVIQLVDSLPRSMVGETIGRQLLRSGTSVGANYRAVKRAKSPADFIAKMAIVEEETDETLYWMELLIAAGLVAKTMLAPLMQEGSEILAMTVASIRTAKQRRQ